MTADDLRAAANELEAQAKKLRMLADELERDARRAGFSLVPTEPGPPSMQRERRATPRRSPDLFKAALDVFGKAWSVHYGGAGYFVLPQDRPQLGRVLRQVPKGEFDALPEMVAAYLADRDPFVVKHRHPLWLFAQRITLYRPAVVAGRREDEQQLRVL